MPTVTVTLQLLKLLELSCKMKSKRSEFNLKLVKYVDSGVGCVVFELPVSSLSLEFVQVLGLVHSSILWLARPQCRHEWNEVALTGEMSIYGIFGEQP